MGRNVRVVSFFKRGEGSNVRNLCERNFLGALALAWEGALIKGRLGATPSPLPPMPFYNSFPDLNYFLLSVIKLLSTITIINFFTASPSVISTFNNLVMLLRLNNNCLFA